MAKAKRKTRKSSAPVEVSYREPKSVDITVAGNGFVVSSYGPKGKTVEVAKSMKEASKIAKSLLEA